MIMIIMYSPYLKPALHNHQRNSDKNFTIARKRTPDNISFTFMLNVTMIERYKTEVEMALMKKK